VHFAAAAVSRRDGASRRGIAKIAGPLNLFLICTRQFRLDCRKRSMKRALVRPAEAVAERRPSVGNVTLGVEPKAGDYLADLHFVA
jgi:hypothetical protein